VPIPFLSKGGTEVGKGKGDYAKNGQLGTEGKMVTSQEKGGAMFNQWKDGVGPYWPFDASIYSDDGGGGHKPSQAHQGQHKFDGVNAKDFLSCIGSGNCFMKFRGSSDANKDYGQPRVYSYVTKPFRVGNMTQAPWELNTSSTLTFTHGSQGSAKLTLAADEGAALSKALVYYHRFGQNGWREAPTLFNPYWRAKLHPFTGQEAAKVLAAAGNTDAAQLAITPGLSL
jgi:hypothetical protein